MHKWIEKLENSLCSFFQYKCLSNVSFVFRVTVVHCCFVGNANKKNKFFGK